MFESQLMTGIVPAAHNRRISALTWNRQIKPKIMNEKQNWKKMKELLNYL